MTPLRRVAVLGAGTMGARIAAHFANAGIPALLLDIVLPNQPNRNAAALGGLDAALKQKPAAFFSAETKSLVTPGNFEDDLAKVKDCDWIIEAVTENLEIKRALLEKVLKHRKPGSIFSTNTSGIPLVSIAEGFPTEFRQHFLGTHFFNPPRYLHLLEMIPGPETLPEVHAHIAEFSDRHLGKGVVPCKDTPNFIANRIGSFLGATVQNLTVEMGLTIEEVDALTGPLIGLPKSASFRLLDIVGLDIWAHVTKNLYDLVPNDPWREQFVLPPFFAQMIERGWIGDKRGQGFYKRTGKGDKKEIQALDLNTLEYGPSKKAKFNSVEGVRNIEDLPQRLRALMGLTDRAGTFLWKLFSDLVLYSASMVPEISDRVVEIDRAMRWGATTPTPSIPFRWNFGTRARRGRNRRPHAQGTARHSSERGKDAGRRRQVFLPGARSRPPPAPRILRPAGQFLQVAGRPPRHHRAEGCQTRSRRGEEEWRRVVD